MGHPLPIPTLPTSFCPSPPTPPPPPHHPCPCMFLNPPACPWPRRPDGADVRFAAVLPSGQSSGPRESQHPFLILPSPIPSHPLPSQYLYLEIQKRLSMAGV